MKNYQVASSIVAGLLFAGCVQENDSQEQKAASYESQGFSSLASASLPTDLTDDDEMAIIAALQVRGVYGPTSKEIEGSSFKSGGFHTSYDCSKGGSVSVDGIREIKGEALPLIASLDIQGTASIAVDHCKSSYGPISVSTEESGQVDDGYVAEVNGLGSDTGKFVANLFKNAKGEIINGQLELFRILTGNYEIIDAKAIKHSLVLKDFIAAFKVEWSDVLKAATDKEHLKKKFYCRGTLTLDGKELSCGQVFLLKLKLEGNNLLVMDFPSEVSNSQSIGGGYIEPPPSDVSDTGHTISDPLAP